MVVWTTAGAVPIADLDGSQTVFAAPDNGAVSSVVAAEQYTPIVVGEASLVKLAVRHADGSSETINTTDEHPFHAAETGAWTRADALQPGVLLSTLSGDAEVVSITFDGERVPVYNLSIPGSPTYYVGEQGLWVHNCPEFPKIDFDGVRGFPAITQWEYSFLQEVASGGATGSKKIIDDLGDSRLQDVAEGAWNKWQVIRRSPGGGEYVVYYSAHARSGAIWDVKIVNVNN